MNIRYPIYEGVYRILTFEQRKYDTFFSQENIIWRQCGLCGRLATIKKRMAYSTIFPAILYRMKCPYSPANYLKGDYEVRAVTMKEQRTTGGELKKMQYHT